MADAISIDFGGLAADIARYTNHLQRSMTEADRIAQEEMHRLTVERAREMEDWSSLSDEIHTWSQDGMLIVGVRHLDFVSDAFALEYGDEVTPPSPLFRTVGPDIAAAAQAASDEYMVQQGF
jgi:hypothetical protein